MTASKEFDNVLDECLERLLTKGETIEQCLQSYLEQAAELEPLLQMAVAAKKAVAVQPRSEFRAEARYQFHAALGEVASQGSRSFLGWFPRWATVVAIVLGLILVGGGTVSAAGYSMPDSPLYPVKLTTEQVRLALTPSELGKAQLSTELADRRIVEIIYMANKGDAQQVEAITQRLDERLIMLATLASTTRDVTQEGTKDGGAPEVLTLPSVEQPAPSSPEEATGEGDVRIETNNRAKLRVTVARYAVNHPAALRAVLQNEKIPESAKPALRDAIDKTVAGYERVLKALD